MNSLEDLLLKLLAARLGADAAMLDPEESFAGLGLDSAGAAGLLAEFSEELGRTLSPVLIWEFSTPRALAAALAGTSEGSGRSGSRSRLSPGRANSLTLKHAPGPLRGDFGSQTYGSTNDRERSGIDGIDEAIALVGMGCRMPGAENPAALWRLLCEGRDAVREIPAERWTVDEHFHPDPNHPETMNARHGGFLDHVDLFDPLFFGISPREAEQMDPQQRLMLELSWEALEDAGIAPTTLAGSETGVFFGAIWADYAALHRELRAETTLHTGPGQALNIVANRVSYALDLRGPSLTVDTACSSALAAAHLACRALRAGDASLALVGGVHLMLSPLTMIRIAKYGGLSPDGRCKTCDARADGFGRGEGGGVMVLKRLGDALRDGDRIDCVIRSSAVNNDGASNGLTAPNPQAQVAVLRKAYGRSNLRPEQVDYVEMHGAGTAVGDPIETSSLSRVLCAQRSADRPLRIGAIKSNLAHLEAASGAAGLIKTALALRHRKIPPNVHFEQPNPEIDLEALRLRIPTALEEWPAPPDRPARAGVNAFGWGGTNAHLVLEEWPSVRLPSPRSPKTKDDSGDAPPPLVFIASPAGSQWCGMGRDLLAEEPSFRRMLRRCDEIYAELSGRSLWREIVHGNDGPTWSRPAFALPAVAVVDLATAALWRSRGVLPDALCGHSLGEITAAHLAGVLTLEDALRVVWSYASMLERVRDAGLAVVGLPIEETETRLDRFRAEVGVEEIWTTGENSPQNCLVAGRADLVDAWTASLAPDVFRARVRLRSANHCPYSEPQKDEIRAILADLNPQQAQIPLFSTVTGGPVGGPELDAEHWARHYAEPVGFAAVIEALLVRGYRRFLEIGPHPVLRRPLEECFAAHASTDRHESPARALACLRRDQRADVALAEASEALADRFAESAPKTHLVLLSARSPEALDESVQRLVRHLRTTEDLPALDDLAATAAHRRSHHEYRLALAVDSTEQIAGDLQRRLEGELVPTMSASSAAVRRAPKIAFVFSGQGPQWWWGKGAELLERESVFAAMIDRCDEELNAYDDKLSIREAVRGEVSVSRLRRPAIAQPVLFAIQMGLDALWRSWGVIPSMVYGHSFGEVAAACSAGALSFEDAVRVAALRGRAMESVLGSGTMASAEISAQEAEELCRPYGDRLVTASLNGPSTTALSGDLEAVDEAIEKLTRQGKGCWPLRAKLPFHSPLMEGVSRELERLLQGVRSRTPEVPLLSTVRGALAEDGDFGPEYWRRNVRRQVLFQKTTEVAIEKGCDVFLEITTQPLLAGAISQTLESRPADGREISVISALRPGREHASMLEALGGLYARGVDFDFSAVYGEPSASRPVALPTYPFQRQRYWLKPGAAPPAVESPSTPSTPPPATTTPVDPVVRNVLEQQLKAFQRLVDQQLTALRNLGDDSGADS